MAIAKMKLITISAEKHLLDVLRSSSIWITFILNR